MKKAPPLRTSCSLSYSCCSPYSCGRLLILRLPACSLAQHKPTCSVRCVCRHLPFIYKRRICAFRYTVIFQPAPEGQLDKFGNQLVWPWPIGTVLFERMVGGKGKIAQEIAPSELVALVKPDAVGLFSSKAMLKNPVFQHRAPDALFVQDGKHARVRARREDWLHPLPPG